MSFLHGKHSNRNLAKTAPGNKILEYWANNLAAAKFQDFVDEVFGGRWVPRIYGEHSMERDVPALNCDGERIFLERYNPDSEKNFETRLAGMTHAEILAETRAEHLRSLWIGQNFLEQDRKDAVLQEVARRSKYADAFLQHQYIDAAVVADEAVVRFGEVPHVIRFGDAIEGDLYWHVLTESGKYLRVHIIFDKDDVGLNIPLDAEIRVMPSRIRFD